jgi:hypothetical protein
MPDSLPRRGFVDLQGLAVAAFCLLVVAAVLGEDAELVVAAGHARLVAEALLDLQGLSVAALCLLVVAAVLGEDAQMMDVSSPTRGGIR